MSTLDIYRRIRPHVSAGQDDDIPDSVGESTPVTEQAFESGVGPFQVFAGNRLVVTTPVVIEKAERSQYFLRLRGNFVEADTPNSNGARFEKSDLESATADIAGGPLNFLHEESHVIGALTSAKYDLAADRITVEATAWRWLSPYVSAVETAAEKNTAWFSMECVGSDVSCHGCGEKFDFETAYRTPEKVCSHLRARSHVRTIHNPLFVGAAAIVPPIRPGWKGATMSISDMARVEAARLALPDISEEDAAYMVQQILRYAASRV